MAKEKDLQKAIGEIKSVLNKKDLESLKDQIFSKLSKNGGSLTDLLTDKNIQKTLQSALKDKNLMRLLQNPEITGQLSNILTSNKSNELIGQLQNLMKTNNSEKKPEKKKKRSKK